MNRRSFVKSCAAGVVTFIMSPVEAQPGSSPHPAMMFDKDGLIVHAGNDGGDTAQREGWYWLGVWVRQHVLQNPWPVKRSLALDEVLRLLEPNQDGVFVRHPSRAADSKDWGLSRDQMVPLVAAMGMWGKIGALRRLWNALPQDPLGGTKHTFNGRWVDILGLRAFHDGDIVGPMTVNLFRRAWGEDPLKNGDPLGIGENELRSNVSIRTAAAAKNRDDTGDDLNLMVMLLMSILRFPSATSSAAVADYKARALSYGSYLGEYRKHFGVDKNITQPQLVARIEAGINAAEPDQKWKSDASGPMGAVRWYHREESGANPQLAELWEPIIQRYLQ